MRKPKPYARLSISGLMLLLAASISQAQVYKWVDANGRTHYSQSKEEAERAQAAEVKIKTHTPSEEETRASREKWQEQDRQSRERQAQRELEQRLRSAQKRQPLAAPPPSLSGGRDDGSDASKCNLARDILSGSVKLRNGGQVGDLERQTAENDIRRFCR